MSEVLLHRLKENPAALMSALENVEQALAAALEENHVAELFNQAKVQDERLRQQFMSAAYPILAVGGWARAVADYMGQGMDRGLAGAKANVDATSAGREGDFLLSQMPDVLSSLIAWVNRTPRGDAKAFARRRALAELVGSFVMDEANR